MLRKNLSHSLSPSPRRDPANSSYTQIEQNLGNARYNHNHAFEVPRPPVTHTGDHSIYMLQLQDGATRAMLPAVDKPPFKPPA
jgi:hypothetical protein